MSNTKYPPSGVLFNNRRKESDRHPDMTGTLEISKEVLKNLVDKANNGEKIEMDLAAYKKNHPKYGEFISLRGSIKREKQFKIGGVSNDEHDKPPF